MKKFILWLGRVPASIRKISNKVLNVTTALISVLQSDVAILVTNIIPGEKDEAIRQALLVALEALRDQIAEAKHAKSVKKYKEVAGQIGALMTASLGGIEYDAAKMCFEKVYEEQKKIAA